MADAPKPSYRYFNGQRPEIVIRKCKTVPHREHKAVQSLSNDHGLCSPQETHRLSGWDMVQRLARCGPQTGGGRRDCCNLEVQDIVWNISNIV